MRMVLPSEKPLQVMGGRDKRPITESTKQVYPINPSKVKKQRKPRVEDGS